MLLMTFSISFSFNIKPCCSIDFLSSLSFNSSTEMDVSRQRSFPNSTTAFAYDTTIMQLLTAANSLERLRAAWIPSICSLVPPVSTSKTMVGGIPLYETAFLKASVESASVGFNFDVPVASAFGGVLLLYSQQNSF